MCADVLEKCELSDILASEAYLLFEDHSSGEVIESLEKAIELCLTCKQRENCLTSKLGILALAYLQEGKIEEAKQTFQRAADSLHCTEK